MRSRHSRFQELFWGLGVVGFTGFAGFIVHIGFIGFRA